MLVETGCKLRRDRIFSTLASTFVNIWVFSCKEMLKWKKKSSNVTKKTSCEESESAGIPYLPGYCEAKVIYRTVREKKFITVCIPAGRWKPGCVCRLIVKNNRLRLRKVDNSVPAIQWPFSGLHTPPVPLLRSPSAGLVYCCCDNASIQSTVTIFFSWICVRGHQSGAPSSAVHLVIVTEPLLWIKSLHPLQTHIDLILNLINHVASFSYQEIEFVSGAWEGHYANVRIKIEKKQASDSFQTLNQSFFHYIEMRHRWSRTLSRKRIKKKNLSVFLFLSHPMRAIDKLPHRCCAQPSFHHRKGVMFFSHSQGGLGIFFFSSCEVLKMTF